MIILNILLLCFCASVLATQIAYDSTLAYSIKKILGLYEPIKYSKALTTWNFYFKLLGSISFVLLPLILIIISLFVGYSKIVQLANCPYCLSVWFSGIFLYLVLNEQLNVVEISIYSLLGIATTHIFESLNTK